MRWLFLFFACLFYYSPCLGQVLLNEIYYDHPGRDEGYEFFELINLLEEPVGLTGYRLEFHDGASTGWVTIWEADSVDTIPAADLFVVGGDLVVPIPDVIFDPGLQNGPDAVRLVFHSNVVDRLGYGELDDPTSYEGQSAPDVVSGMSLSRRADGEDTNDNLMDFAAMSPTPGRFNLPRSDIALWISGTTVLRDVFSRPRVERLQFEVTNAGLLPVESGEITVELSDSTTGGVNGSQQTTIAHSIFAGESVRVEFEIDLIAGLHWLSVEADFVADERPEDNVLKLVRRVGMSPMLVSEVMSYPRAGCPEYVELLNTGAIPYDIANHWIRDAVHDPVPVVSESLIIEPGEYVILTSQPEELLICFENIDPLAVVGVEGAWPSLNHSGSSSEADSVIVLDGHLLPVDRVAYPPQASGTRGMSLERVDLYPSFDRHTWVLNNSIAGGSPASPFSDAITKQPVGRTIDVSSNPFDPFSGEILIVTVPDQGEPVRVVVGVFDIDGCLMAEIGSTAALPSVFVWDGSDSEGRVVLPGLYVLACEIIVVSTGTRRVEKVVVGCARDKVP